MAVQGTPLKAPFIQGVLKKLEPAAYGNLITPFVMGAVSKMTSANYTNRFPTPPIVGAFLVDVEEEMAFDRIMSPYTITGALFPESGYLEPNVGQIWPR